MGTKRGRRGGGRGEGTGAGEGASAGLRGCRAEMVGQRDTEWDDGRAVRWRQGEGPPGAESSWARRKEAAGRRRQHESDREA
eukprot:5988774-Alexandrium_andersonii.AAC.1